MICAESFGVLLYIYILEKEKGESGRKQLQKVTQREREEKENWMVLVHGDTNSTTLRN